MYKLKLLKRLLVALLVFHTTLVCAQLSKIHYIPPITESGANSSTPQDHYLYISTPSTVNINFTIKPIGTGIAGYIYGSVSQNTPYVHKIGDGRNTQLFIDANQTSVKNNNKGYIIESQGVVYVSVRINAGAQAGAMVSKGMAALGTAFRVGSYTNENPGDNYLNFVSVMAAEDDTEVVFSDLPTGLIIENYLGNTPVNVTLNKGESYTIATNSNNAVENRDGLIGCLVNSNKPIVVNCGSANGSFHNGNGRDYGIDQIVGIDKVGTEYIFVKGDGENSWENVLLVAHTNNTSISINGNTNIASINAGEYYLIEGNQYSSTGNMYVETSQPVFAYQGVGATSSEANQGLFFVPPLSCETRGNLDNIAHIETIGNIVYDGGVSIVAKVGSTVTINNLPLSNYNTVGPSTVIGKTDYVTYKITGLTGNISIQSTDELYSAYFNYNGTATSGSFYSGFPSPPEINFNSQFATLGNCLPNISFEAANIQPYDSFQWLFDNGSGFVDLMNPNTLLTPTMPGKYKLIGLIACTGKLIESIEVPISICPDDIDNDGIIDNLDIDNDNDGILNCLESKGDVAVNLSNIANPELIFQDGLRDTSIVTGLYNQFSNLGNTNTFTGNSSGGFTSSLASDVLAENSYSVTFTESVNIKYLESISHTEIQGESFIVKILPVNKNITLVDPENRLLIDTNFDGIYETGITQISGSEIHFKINPSPNGSTPYQFFANQVDGFTFIHKLENTTTNSIFTGALSLSCFNQDTDLDGVIDALDLDSDNDGIPDVIENQGTLVALSGVDADSNGLDDVYDINAQPIDTDGDLILDFLDLDSDNDGIYDLIETGHLGTLLDTNLDGIVDGPNYGTNGWVDTAETSPDSNITGYTLNDFDADGIFSYIDLDSDNDGCSDVTEAGFSDPNADLLLGDIPQTVNTNGLVTNASDGYTIPNSNYLNFAPISITNQPVPLEVCQSSNNMIPLVSTTFDTIQWEVSTDGINWNTIIDDAVYSNSQTDNLQISNTPLAFNGYSYRALLNRNGNSCSLYSNDIQITVNPLPIVNSPVVLIQCDDNNLSTLGYIPFNLTEANNEISNNANNETFSYYLNQTAAQLGDINSTDYINDPTTFINQNISSDRIWARVENTFGCFRIAEVQLNVSTTVIPSTFLATFNQCDDFLDLNGNNNANNDNTDGIATFNFSSVTATILSFIPPGQNPLPPRYFRNEADALAERNEIININNYRNIGYPYSQYIYVRIDSAIANDCLALGPHILLTVEALPSINPANIPRQCDDDTDGIYPFDVSQLENNILGMQNPARITFTYFDEFGTQLPSPLPNPFLTTSQTITVRLTNNITAAPDGPCYNDIAVEFIVDQLPIANPVPQQIVCDGSEGDIDDDGFFYFDTTTFETTIRGSQTGMTILYNYIDENGMAVSNSPSLPNPLFSQSQIITVDVINPVNSTCSATTNIELVVNPLPDFVVYTPQIVCSSNPIFSILLDPIEAHNTETFSYEWLYSSLDGTIVNQFASNNETITVSNPGTYTVTLTKTDGTNCSRTKSIFVDASELATITLDDLTIIDFSENNSVTINTSNLGNGTYQFALSEEGSNIIQYQDEPFFNNLNPGFYTLYVRDSICGVVTLDVSVIGSPKFFTPNDDGVNDFWQIKGLSNTVQPNSTVLIFNRYGKLLKQLVIQSNGWDGTFNGVKLPNDDYWFKLLLEDGREYTGHFTLKR